jgi:hypothetical protein
MDKTLRLVYAKINEFLGINYHLYASIYRIISEKRQMQAFSSFSLSIIII